MRASGTVRRTVLSASRAAAVAGLATLGLSVIPGAVPGASAQAGAAAAPAAATVNPADVPAAGVPASARFVSPPPAVRLPSGLHQACATPVHPGQMACDALVTGTPASSPARAGQPPSYAYGPGDLRSAYALATASVAQGKGVTVAIVDAFNDPHAASDLAVYRSHYKLPACGEAKGCLRVVNQAGGPKLPHSDPTGGWELEESLDLDVVSAICPNCKILLVESSSDTIASLARAEKYAVAHARVVSDSWGSGSEFTSEASFDPDFNHPGVAIVASAGNGGYGTQYPASAQYVTSVGGTTLQHANNARGWAEQVWSGTGSGCSSLEAVSPWQQPAVPAGCQNRTETDVSADADPSTPVAVYDTVKRKGAVPNWGAPAGDSVATSLIASTYALAATAAGGTYPRPRTYAASYPYAHRADFFAVTSGSNGSCEAGRAYLCHGRAGYDGPTGIGTPDGIAGFAPASASAVTVLNPGTQDVERGAQLNLRLTARDGAGGSLAFTSTALPAGLRLSAGGVISGRPARNGSTTVRVTAKDKATGVSGSVAFPVVVLAKLADPHPGTGPLQLTALQTCVASAGSHAVVAGCRAGAATQRWQYIPAGDPGGAGQLKIGGRCLGASGTRAVLGACTGGSSQWWALRSGGRLANPRTGRCLNDPGNSTATGTRVGVLACNGSLGQFWVLPAAPVISGVPGMCLTDPGNSAASGTRMTISTCSGAAAQKWEFRSGVSSTLQIRGKCLTVVSGSKRDGAAIELRGCSGNLQQNWLKGPRGEVLNEESGRCLAVPAGTSASGTKLVQDDCTGSRGEIWAIS
jgi:hypothetical protein